MWRLTIPLFLLAVIAWALLYGVRGKIAVETFKALRQGVVGISIALASIAVIFVFFSLGRYING
jgi:hypothetical protein